MKNKRKGIRIILIFLPFIIVIFALYAAIISTTVVVDNTLKDIISEMDRVSSCNKNISGLQSRNSKMSETSTAFVEAPIVPPYSVPTPAPRELNSMPIGAYVEELTTSATPDSILEELDKLGLEKELLAEVSKAVENMNLMNEAQYKAIYVVKYYVDNSENTDNETGYRIREELSNLITDVIPEYELTEDEKSLSDAALLTAAKEYVSGSTYNGYKSAVSEILRDVLKDLNSSSTQKQSNLQSKLKMSRGFLWGFILLIVLFNIAFVVIISRNIIIPIIKFAKKIDDNQKLHTTANIYETRRLVNAYNSLLDRHEFFQNELRYVAEKDSLTGLPNRFSYNEFLSKKIEQNEFVCVFMFDINNLKEVNDTYGHAAGDELIKKASQCIINSFNITDNCYRIGGDEFVAIIKNIEQDDIKDILDNFEKNQKEWDVSIAIGYSYTDEIMEVGYEELVRAADEMMYEDKKYKKSLHVSKKPKESKKHPKIN